MSALVPGRRFDRGRPLFRVAAPIVRQLTEWACDLEWRHHDRIPPRAEGGIIVVANHLSSVDPVLLGDYLAFAGRWPTFLAKAELFRTPLANRFFRSIGQIPVYRASSEASDALREAEVALKRGETIIIYPEGTITYDPDHWPMTGYTGAARLALRTGRPVIPVAQFGAHELFPTRTGAKFLKLRPRKRLVYDAGEPIDLTDLMASDDRFAAAKIATRRIMDTLTAMVAEIRDEPIPDRVYDFRRRQLVPREQGA